ncbi:uncharacterized protein LOC120570929 [Perca fluviatilis]|uniref:uncharacterized protein LOC120570929 n=1 Tax=Perca fluviatilis TaxID=8168 RepID=UPI001963E41A|nr:uncharacterized protein LOC120570929 [Perca fluviatilis]
MRPCRWLAGEPSRRPVRGFYVRRFARRSSVTSVCVEDEGEYLPARLSACAIRPLQNRFIFIVNFVSFAGIIHEIVQEKTRVTLRCPHSVEGDVTWSRERNGNKTDIITVNVGREIKHIPGSRYGSEADKTLFILNPVISDSGRYFCNNEAAADLTVIPSGTTLVPAPERTSITLTCPHDVGASHVPTWTRDSGGIPLRRFDVSPVDQTLTITDVQPGDSGLYYCDGKPAVYLNVIKGSEERGPVYDEIQEGFVLQPTNGSEERGPVYDEIQNGFVRQPTNVTSLPNESPYSLIGNNYNNKGLSQQIDNTYCLLKKPKATANNQNQ